MACASTLGRAVGGRGCAGGFLDGDVGRATQAGGGAVACSSGGGSGGRAQKKVQKCALRRLQSERVGLGWSNADSEHSTLSSSSHGGVARRRERRADGCAALIGGLSGSFWDGADDSAANEHVASRKGSYTKDTSVLFSLIEDIEPLDISRISKDASEDTMDAMKRTVTGILGLMPSDQFQVTIEAFREPLKRLLVSSMMTGYTLRNAEYRLSLQRSLDLTDDMSYTYKDNLPATAGISMDVTVNVSEVMLEPASVATTGCFEEIVEGLGVSPPEGLNSVSPEVANYIQQLQAKLSATHKELDDCKQALTELELESMVGEEANELLDYLRSLDPDKVAELSQPTSPDVEDVIRQVIDGLLETLRLTKQPSNVPKFGNGASSSITSSWEDEGVSPDSLINIPLHLESTVTASRDYFARLLFWCMLLGHHMRGLEYRLELSRTLSLSGDIDLGSEECRDN